MEELKFTPPPEYEKYFEKFIDLHNKLKLKKSELKSLKYDLCECETELKTMFRNYNKTICTSSLGNIKYVEAFKKQKINDEILMESIKHGLNANKSGDDLAKTVLDNINYEKKKLLILIIQLNCPRKNPKKQLKSDLLTAYHKILRLRLFGE